MILTLPPEIEQHVANLVRGGAYPNAEAVVVDAVKALVREQERQQIHSLTQENDIEDRSLEQILQDAEDSGDYTEMTAQDWEDVEREGTAIVNARKSR